MVTKKHSSGQNTLMEALVKKHYLRSLGYTYVGDSAEKVTSPHFNEKIFNQLIYATKIEQIPVFECRSSHYLFLGGKEKKVPGLYSFYAILPEEEEEKIPDTLREGFRVETPTVQKSLPSGTTTEIKRPLPSKLLRELDRINVLYEKVKSFHFQPLKGDLPHFLSLDDLITLSRMEDPKKPLDYGKLQGKTASEEDRKARKSLDHGLRLSPIVGQVGRNLYTLTADGMAGSYIAVVENKYLPKGYRP